MFGRYKHFGGALAKYFLGLGRFPVHNILWVGGSAEAGYWFIDSGVTTVPKLRASVSCDLLTTDRAITAVRASVSRSPAQSVWFSMGFRGSWEVKDHGPGARGIRAHLGGIGSTNFAGKLEWTSRLPSTSACKSGLRPVTVKGCGV